MKHQLNPMLEGAHALLIRHAKRDPISPGESVWIAALTSEGRADAQNFGATLRDFDFGGTYSSPIQRCVDTAHLILRGWGYPNESVEADRFLLSSYIETRDQAKSQFAVSDPFQLILDQVAKKPLPGFRSLKEGSQLLLSEVKRRMRPGALTLFVTHDALLMPFRAYFLGDTYSRQSWLPFLGNASIYINGSKTFIDGKTVR